MLVNECESQNYKIGETVVLLENGMRAVVKYVDGDTVYVNPGWGITPFSKREIKKSN